MSSEYSALQYRQTSQFFHSIFDIEISGVSISMRLKLHPLSLSGLPKYAIRSIKCKWTLLIRTFSYLFPESYFQYRFYRKVSESSLMYERASLLLFNSKRKTSMQAILCLFWVDQIYWSCFYETERRGADGDATFFIPSYHIDCMLLFVCPEP